jgi:hypothetical protein
MARRISGSNSMAQILAMILSQRRESAKDRRQMAMQMAMLKEKGRTELRNALYKSWLEAEDETRKNEIARQLNSQFGFNLPTGKGKPDEKEKTSPSPFKFDERTKEAYEEGGLLNAIPTFAESAGRTVYDIIGGPDMVDTLGKKAYEVKNFSSKEAGKELSELIQRKTGMAGPTEQELPQESGDKNSLDNLVGTKGGVETPALYERIKNLPKEEQIRIMQNLGYIK